MIFQTKTETARQSATCGRLLDLSVLRQTVQVSKRSDQSRLGDAPGRGFSLSCGRLYFQYKTEKIDA